MRRLKVPAVGALLIVALAAGAPRVALAKGPDFYAPLTIGLIGAGGARSFHASRGADGQAAWELIQQVQLAAVGQRAPLAAPTLHTYYEITIHQDGAALNRLPWSGTPTAQFFFYRGYGPLPGCAA